MKNVKMFKEGYLIRGIILFTVCCFIVMIYTEMSTAYPRIPKQIPDQLTLTVISIRNDHDVVLKYKNTIYVMSVENAYGEAFVPGTVIYFGKGDVVIK